MTALINEDDFRMTVLRERAARGESWPSTSDADVAWLLDRLDRAEQRAERLDVNRLAKAIHLSHAATMEEVCGYPDRPDAIAVAAQYALLSEAPAPETPPKPKCPWCGDHNAHAVEGHESEPDHSFTPPDSVWPLPRTAPRG